MFWMNRTNPRFAMAPESESGGGGDGGESNSESQVETPPASQGQNDFAATVKSMEAKLEAFGQFAARFDGMIQEAQNQKRKASTNTDAAPDYLDEDVKKYIEQKVGQVQQAALSKVAAVEDRQDEQSFRQIASQDGIPADVVKKAEETFNLFRQNDLRLSNGAPFSRLDVLDLVWGRMQREKAISGAASSRDAEDERRDMNRHATVERGGTAVRGGSKLPNPEKLTPQERVKSGGYWEQVLDSSGGW